MDKELLLGRIGDLVCFEMFFIWNTENCMKSCCFALNWKLGLFLTVPNYPRQSLSGLGQCRTTAVLVVSHVARLQSNPGKLSSGAEVTNSCWHCEFNTTAQTLPSQGESFLLPQSSEKPYHKSELN